MDKELSKDEIFQQIILRAKRERIFELIDIYVDQQAKKKAIVFAAWVHHEGYKLYNSGLSTEQLYESEEFKKYFEQQNKEK